MGSGGSKARQADQDTSSKSQQDTEPITPPPTCCKHTYDSSEKPVRSSMRPSLDVAPNSISRRSMGTPTSVGFSVGQNAPDADDHESHRFDGADSVSLKKIVDTFYERVLGDPDLGSFFSGIDMAKLKRHQVKFMALAFGGKELVNEEDPNLNLRRIHIRLIRDEGLTLEHWETFVGHFADTLAELGSQLPADTVTLAMRSIRATKHYFVPIGAETEYTDKPLSAMPAAPAADS